MSRLLSDAEALHLANKHAHVHTRGCGCDCDTLPIPDPPPDWDHPLKLRPGGVIEPGSPYYTAYQDEIESKEWRRELLWRLVPPFMIVILWALMALL